MQMQKTKNRCKKQKANANAQMQMQLQNKMKTNKQNKQDGKPKIKIKGRYILFQQKRKIYFQAEQLQKNKKIKKSQGQENISLDPENIVLVEL